MASNLKLSISKNQSESDLLFRRASDSIMRSIIEDDKSKLESYLKELD